MPVLTNKAWKLYDWTYEGATIYHIPCISGRDPSISTWTCLAKVDDRGQCKACGEKAPDGYLALRDFMNM